MKPGPVTMGPASCHVDMADIGLRADLAGKVREITSVHVPEGERRKGWATALLNYLGICADRHSVALLLEVKSEGDMRDADLEAFYTRFGFEKFQTNPDVLMVRVPRQ